MAIAVACTQTNANGTVIRSTGYLDAGQPTVAAYVARMARLGYEVERADAEVTRRVLLFAESESGDLYLVKDADGDLDYCLIRE